MTDPTLVRTPTSFRCPRCGATVDTTWPSGAPVVGVYVQRMFHVTRRDGTATTEPAGNAYAQLCMQCDLIVWAAIEAALQNGRRK